MNKLVIVSAVLLVASSFAMAADWPSIIRPPKNWRPPPPPHEPGVYRSPTPSRFSYRGKVYPNYTEFQKSPAFEAYQEENRQAGERFDEYLLMKERRRQAAVAFGGYRHHFLASTQIWMDENARWHEIARTAWRDLGVEVEDR